eukprot:COSAG02_NODE_761_length_17476_cov_195.233067_8_plen_77_part_00
MLRPQPVEGCAIGYEDVHCSACSSSPSAELDSFGDPIFKSYYREGLLCVECPEGAVPFLCYIPVDQGYAAREGRNL